MEGYIKIMNLERVLSSMKSEIVSLTVKVSFLENKNQTRDLEGDITDNSTSTSKEPDSEHSETDSLSVKNVSTQADIDDLEEEAEV